MLFVVGTKRNTFLTVGLTVTYCGGGQSFWFLLVFSALAWVGRFVLSTLRRGHRLWKVASGTAGGGAERGSCGGLPPAGRRSAPSSSAQLPSPASVQSREARGSPMGAFVCARRVLAARAAGLRVRGFSPSRNG